MAVVVAHIVQPSSFRIQRKIYFIQRIIFIFIEIFVHLKSFRKSINVSRNCLYSEKRFYILKNVDIQISNYLSRVSLNIFDIHKEN